MNEQNKPLTEKQLTQRLLNPGVYRLEDLKIKNSTLQAISQMTESLKEQTETIRKGFNAIGEVITQSEKEIESKGVDKSEKDKDSDDSISDSDLDDLEDDDEED